MNKKKEIKYLYKIQFCLLNIDKVSKKLAS